MLEKSTPALRAEVTAAPLVRLAVVRLAEAVEDSESSLP
jgi:hypothetical protein